MKNFIKLFTTFLLLGLVTACLGGLGDSTTNSDSGGDSSDETVVTGTQSTIYLGVQKDSSTTAVFKFTFDSSDNSIQYTDDLTLTGYSDDVVRSTFFYDGNLYVGGRTSGNASMVPVSHADFSEGSLIDTVSSGSPKGYTHGLCFLSNGNFIIGGFTQEINEHSDASTIVASSDTQNVIKINSLTRCAEGDSTSELYGIDYDGNSDSDGDIIYLTKSGSDWSESERYDLSALGGGSLFAMVKHTNGNLYAFPQNMGLPATKPIICSNISSLKLNSCIPSTGDDLGSGIIQTAVQIPGSDDMLFIDATSSSNVNLYRLDASAMTKTLVSELSGLGLVVRNQFGVRGMEIVAD
ncbi:MAG: hypothetical protein AB8E15_08195 [Bdellovibrionales bacterium]